MVVQCHICSMLYLGLFPFKVAATPSIITCFVGDPFPLSTTDQTTWKVYIIAIYHGLKATLR